MNYNKPSLTFHEQLALIMGRGLAIPDPDRAMRWLRHVSYYRLSAYFLPFKCGEHFAPGVSFDSVAGLYIFDRKLRLILLDAIERIEVALRTALTYEIAHRYGPFGYTDPRNFDSRFGHDDLMSEVFEAEATSKETFVTHYRKKYRAERHLPIWMTSELLSFGWLSRIYGACHPQIKRKIAGKFSVQDAQFASWLHSLSYVRNVCAHHSRLWNRELAIRPSLPRPSAGWPYHVPSADRLYCVLVIIRHLLLQISPRCKWSDRLFALLDGHPEMDLKSMHFPDAWRSSAPWAAPTRSATSS
jgi:abortive infection bacteriophage resistance protein